MTGACCIFSSPKECTTWATSMTTTHQVRAHREEQPGDEDLINAAAVETLRHAGNVFVLPAKKIPHGSQMAAVMRY